jgi:hypothetical protein
MGMSDDFEVAIEAFKIILKEKASVRRAEDIARRMRKKIEEGDVPITKENLPQFLKSKIDNISQDLESVFNKKTTSVKIVQTNILTKVTFQFKGPVDQRFEELSHLYTHICKKELQN